VLFHTPRLKPENSPREPLGLKAELPRMNAGAPTPDINGANDYGLAPSQCFEGTSFSRFSLSQNVRLFGGSNQGWMKVDAVAVSSFVMNWTICGLTTPVLLNHFGKRRTGLG